MKIYKYPKKEQWAEIVERPRLDLTKLNETVSTVLGDIRERGDEAVREYELKFDKVRLSTLAVTEQEMDEAELLVSNELRDAIILAHHNIKVFHISQRFVGQKVKTQEGVTCWQKSVAIERVGLYIPGGTASLFSTVLMLATPARIAGCKEIVLCTPPDKEGKVNPAILVAARIAGVSKIYKIGGVQAIGAMAYGTESVPKVFKIFGPGNQYVMAAKQHVSLDEVAIDMPAGPSEVCVLADETARAEFVAGDGTRGVCGCRPAVTGRARHRLAGAVHHHQRVEAGRGACRAGPPAGAAAAPGDCRPCTGEQLLRAGELDQGDDGPDEPVCSRAPGDSDEGLRAAG